MSSPADRPTSPLALPLLLGGALTLTYSFLSSPLDLLRLQDTSTALGTWAVAPFVLAAAATLFGDIEAGTHRKAPTLPPALFAALLTLLPLIALALISAGHQPLRFPPHDWLTRLFPTALTIGAGLGLSSLFWQGVTQQRLPDAWGPGLRALVTTTLGAVVFSPFWFNTTSDLNGFFLWLSLVLLLAVPAVLYELGLKLWQIALLATLTATAAVYAHPAPFLI